MTPHPGDLEAHEGVEEGSAASTTEADGRRAADVVGEPTEGPVDGDQETGPDPVETIESRRAQDGQQLAAGEG